MTARRIHLTRSWPSLLGHPG